MINEHFPATGAYGAVQGLLDQFNRRLQNEDVQDFDTRWDQAMKTASETPTELVLEGLYKSKLLKSIQLQIVLILHNIRNNEQLGRGRVL